MKKYLLLLLVLGVLSWGGGCREKCGGDSRGWFDVQGLQAENVLRQDSSRSIRYDHIQQYYDSTSTVDALLYGVQLNAKIQFHAAAAGGGGFAAFACDPGIAGQNGTPERIGSILITSNTDFDAAHPAGSQLNDLFAVSAVPPPNTAWRDSLSTVIIPLKHFVDAEPMARQSLQLWLRKRPTASLEHRFRVLYRQTNGEQYELQVPEVRFQ